MIYVLSGSKGRDAELNFAVVGGTTQPTNPKENTIWVETDLEITEWSISSESIPPNNPIDGMVWILDATASSSEFNAIKENSLMVYPRAAKHYINGEWVVKPIQCYTNGEWNSVFSAIIEVTYEEGYVCQCSNGEKTLTAPDVSGFYAFVVPSPGEWIISCTGENFIESKEVNINTDREQISVEVLYFPATITVTYTSGTLTVANGIRTFTHSGGGTKTFNVDQAGTWTVEAVYSTITKTSTVSITTSGDSKTITISYDFIAFANGAYKDIGVMNGMSLSSKTLTLTASTSTNEIFTKWASSNIAIDVTPYKTLRVAGSWTNNNAMNASYRRAGIGLTKSSYAGSSAAGYNYSQFAACQKFSSSTSGTYNIDVSSLSGKYYISAFTDTWSDNAGAKTTVVKATDIRLLV